MFSGHFSLQLVDLRMEHQVNGFMGCDYNIEAVIRVCKDQLGLTGCQARSARVQWHPLACCLVACCVLERERHDRQLSIYKLKRQLSCRGRSDILPALEQIKSAA
jgi:hypothetical protein